MTNTAIRHRQHVKRNKAKRYDHLIRKAAQLLKNTPKKEEKPPILTKAWNQH